MHDATLVGQSKMHEEQMFANSQKDFLKRLDKFSGEGISEFLFPIIGKALVKEVLTNLGGSQFWLIC